MRTKRESIFDMPMILSLLALCCIVLFIFYAEKKHQDSGATVLQRDSVEVVMSETYTLTFPE